MAKPRIFATAGQAFSDIVHAARTMPLLIAVSVVASFGYDLLYNFAPRDDEPGGLLATLAFGSAWAVLMAPVFIGILRFIIVGEVTPSYRLDLRDARVRAFCAWSVGLFLVMQFPAALAAAYVDDDQRRVATIIVSSVVIVWTALIFPAVAVDAPGATLRNAIADIRGSFWRALAVLLLTFLPFLIVILIVLVVAAFALTSETSDTSMVAKTISAIVDPVSSLAVFCSGLVWTAAFARLFLALADHLRRPASH